MGSMVCCCDATAAGPTYDEADADGRTPLFFAACDGNEKSVEQLLGAGAKVDQAQKDGITPLYAAVNIGTLSETKDKRERRVKCVELLLRATGIHGDLHSGSEPERESNRGQLARQSREMSAHPGRKRQRRCWRGWWWFYA